MRIEAIIFDKDGTLFDFQATWGAWASGFLGELSDGDDDLHAVLADAIGFDPVAQRFSPTSIAVAGTPGDVASALIPYLPDPPRQSALVDRLNQAAAYAPLQEAVPLRPYLQALADRGLALGLVTNDAEAPAMAHLETTGIASAFGFIAGCDSGHGAKPAPGQILAALGAFGVAPEAAVMVGDSRHDLLAGRAAGTRTFGVLTGLATADDLAPLADAVMPDIGHLPAWLDAE